MTAQAKPKTEDLMDSIRLHKDGLRKINQFERNRLISDAESLRGKTSDWYLFNFFGMIACLFGDTNEARKNHQLAFEKYKLFCEQSNIDFQVPSENHLYLEFNYISTLFKTGFMPECIKAGEDLLEKYPSDFEMEDRLVFKTIVTLVAANLFLGRLHESAKFLNRMDVSADKHWYHEVIMEALMLFEEKRITDEEAEKILSHGFELLHNKNLFLSEIDANIVDDCLWIDLYVDFPERVE